MSQTKKTDAKTPDDGKTPPSQYLLVVAAGDAKKAERVTVITAALKAAQLTVEQSLNAEGDEIRFVIGAGSEALCKTAEHLGYCKPRASDGEMGLFEYELRDEFLGYSEGSLWKPCEAAALLLSRIGDVLCKTAELERAGLTPPSALQGNEAKDTRNLVRTLEHSEALVEKLPVSLPRKASFKGDALDVWEAYGSEAALYFGWMDHLSRSLYAPAAVGLVLYVRKAYSAQLAEMYKTDCLEAGDAAQLYCPLLPSEAFTVDDDPWLPVFSVFIVLWASSFLATWKQKQNEYGWAFGLTQGAMPPDKLHSHEEPPPPSLFVILAAYGLSVGVTCMMLALAFGAMVCSLNLQGYIHNQLWTERYFYVESLAKLAEEGQIFDPNQTGRELFGFETATGVYLFPLIPVLGHVVVILTLNPIYSSVAEWLTSIEPHAEERAAERSMQLKRFGFEAFDCYIALFYLAFVQCDVRRLRVELISIYTIDSFRRVVTESVLPWVMQRCSKSKGDPLGDELLRDE
jgi:cytochrome bd-type quinol oxidase subunit 2